MFVTPEFVFTTTPSGSMRVTVASLYCLPLTVVKSSENAAAAKDKSENIKSFVCTCRVGPVQICSQISVFQSRRIAGQRNTQLTIQAVMYATADSSGAELSEGKLLWSNFPLSEIGSKINPEILRYNQNDKNGMASSTRQNNIPLIQRFRNRIRAGATLRTTIALIGFSFAVTGCRQHVAVPQVDP